jgi:competence protein ComEC
MIKVALWVNGLPGAVGRIQAFGTGPLLIGTAGLLIVCLLRTPLRWSGAALVIAGGFWAVSTPRPDLLIAGDGQAAVVRGSDGRLSVLHSGRDSFAIKEWLAADADERTPKDPSLASGITCDAIGCIGKLRDGRFVSIALAIEAFAEDCSRAAVVMSLREAPSSHCTATLIDRNVWRAYGAVALRWTGDSFEQSVTHVPGNERPWSQSPTIAAGDEVRPSSPRSDAAPRSEDLDAGD